MADCSASSHQWLPLSAASVWPTRCALCSGQAERATAHVTYPTLHIQGPAYDGSATFPSPCFTNHPQSMIPFLGRT